MIQKPWVVVLWSWELRGPGAADGRKKRTCATVFPDQESACRWVEYKRLDCPPWMRFTLTDMVDGDPVPYCGDPTTFEFAKDTVTIAEDLLCPIYFPS